jgi:hypothetical protein
VAVGLRGLEGGDLDVVVGCLLRWMELEVSVEMGITCGAPPGFNTNM